MERDPWTPRVHSFGPRQVTVSWTVRGVEVNSNPMTISTARDFVGDLMVEGLPFTVNPVRVSPDPMLSDPWGFDNRGDEPPF